MTKFYWRIGESTNRLIGDSVMRWGDAMKRHRDWAEIHFCVWRALRKCVKKRSGHRIFSEEKQKCREERRLWMHRRNKIAARWWIESMLGTWIFLLRLGINNASIASALAAQEIRQAQWPIRYYNWLSFIRSAFSAIISLSMQSWMSPFINAFRL